MLDSDLAELYQVETKNLNKAVGRNLDRFPADFMFKLTAAEESLRFQFGTSNKRRGGRRYLPYEFTERGVAMLSSVLNSKRAVQVNIAIVRAFMRLRELLSSHKDVAHQVEKLARTQNEHGAHITAIWKTIQKLIEPPEKPRRTIGFKTDQ
jgi:phage regulator Rha-like protein